MFASLANLDKRFAVFRAVNLLFVIGLLVTTTLDTHVHAAHAGHEHNRDVASAHAHGLAKHVGHGEKNSQSQHQDEQGQDKPERDQNGQTESDYCCVLMLPTAPTIDFGILNHSKYVLLVAKFHSRRPDGLKRPPKHSA
ncbi:MAG: hypothetical protein ACRBCJ_02550 [Hyphomicrobiaceae bacterium]